MQCPSCKTINPAQARFCMGCGLHLVEGIVCATCHTLLPSQAHYCFHCGRMVRINLAEAGQPVLPAPPASRRPEATPTTGLQPVLIGMETQLALLEKCGRDLADGRGQIVSVTGESGVGKSRLVTEFRRQFADSSANGEIHWVSAQALSFSESISYWLAAVVFRDLLGLGAEARQEDVLFNLWEQAESLLSRETAREMAPFLANLLGIEMKSEWGGWIKEFDPKVRQKQTFWAAREFFSAAAHHTPLIIVLEDLQWADEASLALFEDLFSLIHQAPVMFVLVSRIQKQKSAWRLLEKAGHDFESEYTEIVLNPLNRAESEAMLRNILPGASFSPAVVDEIYAKSIGNPLYLQEVARTMIESQVVTPIRAENGSISGWQMDENRTGSIQVPDNLHGAIAAHIDQLTEDARQALQMAAVIGPQFQSQMLQNLGRAEAEIGLMLTQLERHNLIRPSGSVGSDGYVFPNPLVQEVAYENLLTNRRQEFHFQIAQTLENMLGNRAGDECEMLAHHFSRSTDPQRAIPYLEMAGRKAQAQFANETAIQHYNEIVRLLGPDDWQKKFDTLFLLQQVNGLAGRNTDRQANLEQMRTLAVENHDNPRYLIAINKLADLCQWIGRYDESVQYAEQALEMANTLGSESGQAEALHTLGVVRYYRADYANAKTSLKQATRMRQKLGDANGALWSLMYQYMIHFMQGEYDQAHELNIEAQAAAESRRDWFQMGIHLTNAGRISLRLGEYDLAQQQLELSQEMKTRVGDLVGRGFSTFAIGQSHYFRGHYPEARSAFQESLKLRESIKDRRGLGYSIRGLGLVDLDEGRYEAALARFQQAYSLHQELGLKSESVTDLSLISQAHLQAGQIETAAQVAEQVWQALQEGLNAEDELPVYLNLYRVWRASHNPAAITALEQAEKAMLTQASRILKPEVRQDFLDNVKVNQEIRAARRQLDG